jgi:predicted transcriptional regulator YheO
MFSKRFYKIVAFILKYACLTGINGIQLDPKTASTFITQKNRKRNNFGMLCISVAVSYYVSITIHVYFREDKRQFPFCYIFSLVHFILWIAILDIFVHRDEMNYLLTQTFKVTKRFHSKICIPRSY